MTFPVVKVKGSPYDIGYDHGSKCKDLVHGALDAYFGLLAKGDPLKVSKKKILSVSKRYIPYVQEYAPDLVDEMKGVAEGADVSSDEIFCHNFDTDLFDLFNPRLATTFGCTSFAASSEVTADRDVFIGQAFDYPGEYQKYGVILKIELEYGLRAIVWTIAGRVGYFGMNSEGIGAVINDMFCADIREGVPRNFIRRKVLQQQRVGDSIGAVITARRRGGANNLIADKNSEIFDIETVANDFEVTSANDGYIVHTNHYVTDRFKPYDLYARPGHSTCSYLRLSRFTKLLKEKLTGKITLEDLKGIMKDHINYPFSICRHPCPTAKVGPTSSAKTVAGVIMQPKNLSFWITFGPPCKNEYVKYKL